MSTRVDYIDFAHNKNILLNIMVNPLDNLLTPEQVSKKLKVSVFTVYRWIKAGKLKAIKLTPRVFRIEDKELNAFLNKRKAK